MTHSPFKARFAAGGEAVETWSGLHGSSVALALLAAASHRDGITLVVTRSSHQAQVLARDLLLLREDKLPVLLFPDHETLPYDPFSPHPDIIAERLKTLASLSSLGKGLLLCPVSSLVQRLPPAEYILQRSFDLAAGDRLVIDDFRKKLDHAGYSLSEQVDQAGQYAVRGSVIDLYPAGSSDPYRIDLFDEEIDSIRVFEPDSQRSSGKVESIELLPAREYPCDDEGLESFRRAFRLRFDVDTRKVMLYQDLRSGVHPQGLEQYLPLFYDETSLLLDYIDHAPQLVLQPGVFDAARDQARRTRERWEQRRHDLERPVLDPEELFFSPEEIEQVLLDCPTVYLPDPDAEPAARPEFNTAPAPDLHIHERGKEAAADLHGFLESFSGRTLFAADTPGRR